ncbi:neuropeptide Y receptor type 2-like [Ptychodera flava]|uniref:neuropeptide Y receptor type 2-like n=1 Tax=Ptychodera flava TaxID=63121 RepID=UPI00396A5D22
MRDSANITTGQTPTAEAATSLWQPINIVQILFGCVGVIGNAMVCLTISRKKSLQNLTNRFIASLAITDLISSALWVLSVFSRRFPPSDNPSVRHFQCVVVEGGYLFWISILASTYQLVAITLERLFAIVYPVRHRIFFSRRWAAVGIAASWILPFAVLANFPIFHKMVDGACVYIGTQSGILVHGLFLFCATYLAPLVTMTWAYIKIWQSLKIGRSQQGEPGSSHSAPETDHRHRARRKVVQMLLIVFVTFVVCWTPDQLMVLMHNIGLATLTMSQFGPVQILALCNSISNPFIYAFKNKQYRDGIRELFCFGHSPAQVGVESTTSQREQTHTTAATSTGLHHTVETGLATVASST